MEIPIKKEDTGGSILKQYDEIYPRLIDEIISDYVNGDLSFTKQDETKATYFPKRIPEDGLIDFNWQRERIINWVRAMCPPEYPGAFYFHNGKKIIVSKAEFSDLGFVEDVKNGTIMHIEDKFSIIKSSNGCIKSFNM